MNGKRLDPPHGFCPKGCIYFEPRIEGGDCVFADDREVCDIELSLHCENENVCEQMAKNTNDRRLKEF